MKATRYPLLLGLLPLGLRAQISTDTCCAPAAALRAMLPARPVPHGQWRLTSSLGAAALYRYESAGNQLFGNAGGAGTIAADYYFRRRVGLGLQAGGLSFNLRPAYAPLLDQVLAAAGQSPGAVGELPARNAYSFHLLAGPVLSLAVGPRITLTAGARGGFFYTDAPAGAIYQLPTNQLLYQVSTTGPRWQPGGVGSLAVYYSVAPQVRLGLGAAAFASQLTYAFASGPGQPFEFTRRLTGYSAFASLAVTLRARPASQPELPVVLPTCYAPVLAGPGPGTSEVAPGETPQIAWKSGAPIYVPGEEFIVRLFTLPGNQVLLERLTSALQLTWPATLKLPEGTTQLYYTIQASRRDQAGQRCLSQAASGSIRVARK